jgi:hypothetical protein
MQLAGVGNGSTAETGDGRHERTTEPCSKFFPFSELSSKSFRSSALLYNVESISYIVYPAQEFLLGRGFF